MAKFECNVISDFDRLVDIITDGIVNGSISASFEDHSDFIIGDTRCVVLVFERYSAAGKNRLSLNVTLFGNSDTIKISAITSGGSQALFFKLNTFGEESFLDAFKNLLAENHFI